MIASASIFRGFLTRLLQNTEAVVNGNLPAEAQRPRDFEYDEITVVAHSLGAVIVRRALLDATRLALPWAAKIKLVLYAPAHKGASVTDLALEAASGFGFTRFFGSFARFESPLIDQLKPDSKDLAGLAIETEKALEQGGNRHLVALRVVIAEFEKIVRNETFCDDPPPETIPDTTHTSVCKPRQDFRSPLEHLEVCL